MLPIGSERKNATKADPAPAAEPAAPDRGEQAASLLSLQQGAGNRATDALVQAKLRVGAADDHHEREADRVADAVVRNLQRSPSDTVGRPTRRRTINRKIQAKADATIGADGGEVDPDTDARIRRAKGSGAPLDDGLRQSMEGSFGADFSNVRVHDDANARDLNTKIQAKAFTTGSDIFFRSGDYAPATTSGQKLLAHELTHVVQQGAAGPEPAADIRRYTTADESGTKEFAPRLKEMTKEELYSIVSRVQAAEIELSPEEWTEMDIRIDLLLEQESAVGEEAAKPTAPKKTRLEHFLDKGEVAREFVTEEHRTAIADYCKKKNVILSCRDTGSLSLKRIEEGAKPKPHTILEKSIKQSSLAGAKGEGGEAERAAARVLKEGGDMSLPKIKGEDLANLVGFVGRWDDETKELLGLRVDAKDVLKSPNPSAKKGSHEEGLNILQEFLEGVPDRPYIPMDKFAAFRSALPEDRWKQFLYTGDYDLHEVYVHNKAQLEGSAEKARTLTGINTAIATNQKQREAEGAEKRPLREGKLTAHKKSVKLQDGRIVPADTIHGGSPYAMIQHGDQMGYITNQIHEGRLKKETVGEKAQAVIPVAQESPSALAWCVRGQWYVTNDKAEHSQFRSLVGVTAGSGWSDKFQSKLGSGELRTIEHSKKKGERAKRGEVASSPSVKELRARARAARQRTAK